MTTTTTTTITTTTTSECHARPSLDDAPSEAASRLGRNGDDPFLPHPRRKPQRHLLARDPKCRV